LYELSTRTHLELKIRLRGGGVDLRIRGPSYTWTFVYADLRIQYTISYTQTNPQTGLYSAYTNCHSGGSYTVNTFV